jgi:hypothetical protein
MGIGDRVKVKDVGSKVFNGRAGIITARLQPNWDWAVLLDGTADTSDEYGFNTSELELEAS